MLWFGISHRMNDQCPVCGVNLSEEARKIINPNYAAWIVDLVYLLQKVTTKIIQHLKLNKKMGNLS